MNLLYRESNLLRKRMEYLHKRDLCSCMKILFGIVFLFLSSSLYSQTHYSSNVSIGGKMGADFSRVFFNPSVEQGFLPGFTCGFQARYIEENHFGLVGELNFSQRGWKENFEGAPYSYSRTLNYMDLGVYAHIYFGRRGKFFVNAGPQIGVFLGESTSSNFNPAEMNSLPGFPIRNRTNNQMLMSATQKLDYGISAGVGGEYNLKPKHSISVEFRFYYGLGNIFPSKRADVFNSSNQMTLAATIGYWFRIK